MKSSFSADAFGSPMSNRSFNASSSRYGFNGKEKDDEIKGGGNSLDFGARIYDSRLGRWFKPDPLESEASGWSPFRFGFDNPILFGDKEGMFEVDEATKKAYPKLDAYFKNIAVEYADKPEEFKKAFKKWGSLSDEDVKGILEYGKGPKIAVANIDITIVGADGNTTIAVNGQTNRDAENPGFDINKLYDDPMANIIIDDDVANAYEKAEGDAEKAGKKLVL